MAHFAELDSTGRVVRVLVVANAAITDAGGNESEAAGVEFCKTFAPNSQWVQTSYNGRIRKNFAGVGYTYDAVRDAFIPPKPYPSWVLDEATCRWQPPVPRPAEGRHRWDEQAGQWVTVAVPPSLPTPNA